MRIAKKIVVLISILGLLLVIVTGIRSTDKQSVASKKVSYISGAAHAQTHSGGKQEQTKSKLTSDTALIEEIKPDFDTVQSGENFFYIVKLKIHDHRPTIPVPFVFTIRPISADGSIKKEIVKKDELFPDGVEKKEFEQETKCIGNSKGGLPPGMYLLTVSQLKGAVSKFAVIRVVSAEVSVAADDLDPRTSPAYTPISRALFPPRRRLGVAVSGYDPQILTVKAGDEYKFEVETANVNLQDPLLYNTKVKCRLLAKDVPGMMTNEEVDKWVEKEPIKRKALVTPYTRFATKKGDKETDSDKFLKPGIYLLQTCRQVDKNGKENPDTASVEVTLIVE
ncbi:MAG: hypothetical protein H7145_23830 [Akkermansiaceae bacterium]|nr:hypothetical protein [Armatimonadota bacterium]